MLVAKEARTAKTRAADRREARKDLLRWLKRYEALRAAAAVRGGTT